MNEQEIKLDVRLHVLEYFVAAHFAMTCLEKWPEEPQESFDQLRKAMVEGARMQTYSTVDPAMSDLLSAELEDAATRLSNLVSDQISLILKGRKARGSS